MILPFIHREKDSKYLNAAGAVKFALESHPLTCIKLFQTTNNMLTPLLQVHFHFGVKRYNILKTISSENYVAANVDRQLGKMGIPRLHINREWKCTQ